MPKKDAAQNALSIVEQVTGGPLKHSAPNLPLNSQPGIAQTLDSAALRKQIMQEMGRRGGKKGGKARAAKLSKSRRSEIAKGAAAKRWNRPKKSK